jgi:hypothetical protein
MSNTFSLEELKDRLVIPEVTPTKTINDIYAEKKSSFPEGVLLGVSLHTPMKAKDIRALLNRKVVGVETFAVGDEVELSTASLVFSIKSYED